MSQTIRFSFLLQELITKAYTDLTRLCENLVNTPKTERAAKLLKYFKKQRIRFIRVLVLFRWGVQQISDIKSKQELIASLKRQETALQESVDYLFNLFRFVLPGAKVLVYDIPAAVDVLSTGTYSRLPSSIKKLALHELDRNLIPREYRLTENGDKAVLQKLSDLIYVRLLSESIPKEFNILRVENGRLYCGVKNEFLVTMTLWNSITKPAPWKLLSLKIEVQPLNFENYLGTIHEKYIESIAQNRMMLAKQPFRDLFNTLHSFCRKLQLDIMNSQLSQKDKKVQVPIHKIEYDPNEEYLKIYYWKNPLEPITLNTGNIIEPTNDSHIFLTVSLDKKTQNLSVSHNPPLLCELPTLVPKAVSAEKLIFEIASLHSNLKLENLLDQLKGSQNNKLRFELKERRLSIYLFGSTVLQVFVGIHDGKFLLQGEGCGNLEKFENNLNLNHDSFLDIVTELNKNSVLDTFKKMKFLTNTTVPKTPKDTVVFAFIEYGTLIYTLHVEVDEECVPNFYFVMSNKGETKKTKILFYKDPTKSFYQTMIEPSTKESLGDSGPLSKKRKGNNEMKFLTLSSLIFESPDTMETAYQLLDISLSHCRNIILRYFILDKAEDCGFNFVPIENEQNTYLCNNFLHRLPNSIEMDVDNQPDFIKNAKLVISEGSWKISLFEIPECKYDLSQLNFMSQYTSSKSDSNVKISYDEVNCCFIFEYTMTTPSSYSFVRFYDVDFQGLKMIKNCVTQYLEWKSQDNSSSSLFNIQLISTHHLVMNLLGNEEKICIEFSWAKQQIIRENQGTMQINSNLASFTGSNTAYIQFLTNFLNRRREFVPVLISFLTNYQTRVQIEKYIYSNMIHNSTNPPPTCYFTPGMVTIIPQSIFQFRINFFRTYSLDIRVFGESGFSVEDSMTQELEEVKEITKEMEILKNTYGVIPNNDLFLSNLRNKSEEIKGLLQNQNKTQECYFPISAVMTVFKSYYNFLVDTYKARPNRSSADPFFTPK